MSDKVYQSVSGATVIVDGGDPLPGCPASWDEAHEWADRVNKDGNKSEVPFWSWDCGFKLDFDGPLVSVSSRFYPPKSHYGPTWDGSVAISVLGNPVITKSFDCKTLDELKKAVEIFALGFAKALEQAIEPTEGNRIQQDKQAEHELKEINDVIKGRGDNLTKVLKCKDILARH